MEKYCRNCKYAFTDYVYDEDYEDEYEIATSCSRCNDCFDEEEETECPDYKEYGDEPYEETNTECDICEYRNVCKAEPIDCTSIMDSMTHEIRAIGSKECLKYR